MTHHAPGSPLAFFGASPNGRSLARRSVAALAPVFLAALSFGAPVEARAESPVRGLVEVKLGGYYPSIDEEFSSEGPFESFFGPERLLMGEIGAQYYVLEGFGRLGLGVSAGYSRVTGDAQVRNGGADDGDEAEGEEDGAQTSVGDETSFRVLPLRLSAVYRYDYSAVHHGIPLVPALKAGLDYHMWRVTGSDGETATSEGVKGSGATTGWHVGAGLYLLLDFIEPGSAAAFDLHWGINNSYVFAEYLATNVDDFGGEGFDLSDRQWLFGLAFEF